jgi:hypothetical protein
MSEKVIRAFAHLTVRQSNPHELDLSLASPPTPPSSDTEPVYTERE